MKRGKFIVVEGCDLSGKTTFVNRLKDCLDENDVPCITTGEPGGSHVGGLIRDILVNNTLSPETRAMLFLANRQDHIENIILPALERGLHVICSRYVWSTYALQFEVKDLAKLVSEKLQFPDPDYVFFLDVDEQRVADILVKEDRRMDVMDKELTAKHELYRSKFLLEFEETDVPKALVKFNRRREMGENEFKRIIFKAFEEMSDEC